MSASPGTVTPGGTEHFAASVQANTNISNAVVDFEVYNSAGARVYQTSQGGVALPANAPRTVTASWAVPATLPAGTYRLAVGVFSADWSTCYQWNNYGASFTVGSGGSSSSASPVALGVYEAASPWDGGAALDAYATEAGHKPGVAMWYEDWSTNFSTANVNVAAARGETPMISWDPCKNNATVGGNPCTDSLIAGGVADGYLHAWARAAAAWGKPLYLRFAWEMNGNWTPYSPGLNGNTAVSYIAMWRHVHDLFVQDGATNVRWVWCPNSDSPLGVPMRQVYPGDAYVDDAGFDWYNWGALQPSWSTWTSLLAGYSVPYNELTAFTSKPIIVGETGSTEVGGDKGAWITQGFLSDLPARFPHIRAVVWYDAGGWAANTSPASLAAWRQVAASPLYHATLP